MHFSAQEWATVITAAVGAVAAAIVSIIHAFKSQANSEEIKARLGVVESTQGAIQEQQIQHEKAAERRAGLPVAGRLRPPAGKSDVREQ